MIRFLLLIGLFAVCACQAKRAPSVDESLADAIFVLPGTFSQQTTVADLQARFGTANVQLPAVPGSYGDSESEVVLFPDDPTRRAYVSFHDAQALRELASIEVRDAGSRWRGKHGVHVGMSFAELRRLNRKPFYFSGFDEQYRGAARDQWSPSLSDDDAELGAFDVAEGEHMYFGVSLVLRGQAKSVPSDAYPHDEASISSDDPQYPLLGDLVEVTAFNATTSLDDEWE